MNPFSKPFDEICFSDVEDFCKKKLPEGITLDYKKEIPRDLAKHIAAFSNTVGGMIIIGVEEKPTTSEPLKWAGILNDGKVLERLNQFATNVHPLPTYKVRLTNEKKGKVFALLNIMEGDAQPYIANGDPTVWMRVGNISKALTDREDLIRMAEKKSSASNIRQNNLKNATNIFNSGLDRAEKERRRILLEAKAGGKEPPTIQKTPYDEDNSFLNFSLQPFYPRRDLIKPQDIKGKLNDLYTQNRMGTSIPPPDMEPIPNGLFALKQNYTGDQIRCYQLYGDGLINYTEDIWWRDSTTNKAIYISHIANILYKHLIFARKFYQAFGYVGLLVGKMTLDNVLEADVHVIVPEGYTSFFGTDYRIEKLNDYSWDIDLDTHILNDEESTKKLFKDIVRQVYWDLGIESVANEILEKFIEQNNWV